MENKHTQGPWRVSPVNTNGSDWFEILWSADGECVTDHVYTLPDATLIAAAPDMLLALQDLENDDGRIPKRIWDNILRVINKATLTD